jgi:hypothetical protein
MTEDANDVNNKIWRLRKNKKEQTAFIANWMRSKFHCTAEIDPKCKRPNKKTSPCKIRFCQSKNLKIDQQELCMFCQIHQCSDYCLRLLKNKKQNKTKQKGKDSNMS